MKWSALFLASFLAIGCSSQIAAVDFGWVRTWGGPGDATGMGVATDGSGNVYITGHFTGTADFDPAGGDPRTSNGEKDVFLSKFGSSGNFEWARTWGGSGNVKGIGIATDASGNVYVSGGFEGTADFAPGGGGTITSNGGVDVFLSKFDSSGNINWVRTWGGLEDQYSTGVATDSSGNVYISGDFKGTIIFDPRGSAPDTSRGYFDVFLSKFSSSGDFNWSWTWGGPGDDYGTGVATDDSGNVYVSGFYYSYVVSFKPGDQDIDVETRMQNWNGDLEALDAFLSEWDLHASNGESDAFLSKFDASGRFEWARPWGGPERDRCFGVAIDGSGNIYATGIFQGVVEFDPDGSESHTSTGGYDMFLSKYNSSGSLTWVRTLDAGINWFGNPIAADSTGNVYVTGHYKGTVDFDPGGGDPHTSNGRMDGFLSYFSSSGNFGWAKTWGGSSGDSGLGLAVDGSGNVCVTGFFEGKVDFDPGGGDLHTSNGESDVFLSKFTPDGE